MSRPIPGTTNSWRPQATGTLRQVSGGVLIETEYGVSPGVRLFTLVHGALLLGITWLMGIFAFSSEMKRAKGALMEASGATVEGDGVFAKQVLADPDEPGSAVGAPWSFQTTLDLDNARFRIRGPRSWHRLGGASSIWLVVEQGGVELHSQQGLLHEVPYGDLQEVLVDGEGLEIRRASGPDIGIAAEGHPERDLQWLAAYVTARAAERRQSADQLAEQRARIRAVQPLQE